MRMKIGMLVALGALWSVVANAQAAPNTHWIQVGMVGHAVALIDTYTVDPEPDGVRVWMKVVGPDNGGAGEEVHTLWLVSCETQSVRRLAKFDREADGHLVGYNYSDHPSFPAATGDPVASIVSFTCGLLQVLHSPKGD